MSDIAPDAGVAPAGEPAVEVDLFEANPTQDQFPRSYVEKLRHEAAQYRTSYNPYKETFEGVDEDVRDYLLELNRTLVSGDPKVAAQELRELLSRIDPDTPQGQAVAAAVEKAEEAVDEDKPLTLKQWKEIQEREAKAAKAENEVQAIYEEAKTIDPSYDKDSDKFGDLASLLYLASHHTKGDLKKAHEIRANRFAEAVQSEVDRQIAEIQSGARKWAPVSTAGTSPASKVEGPKSFEEARKGAKAYLDRLFTS